MRDVGSTLENSSRLVLEGAHRLGLSITIDRSDTPTRTAEEAAQVRGCSVGQIVKSLIFKGAESGKPILLLVSGANRVNEQMVAASIGEALMRPDAAFVREMTGFAIGGIPPFGHRTPLTSFMDTGLMAFDLVYAAAGTPHSTFAIEPQALQAATEAIIMDMKP